jgi:hypothetical protein
MRPDKSECFFQNKHHPANAMAEQIEQLDWQVLHIPCHQAMYCSSASSLQDVFDRTFS